MSDKKLKWFCYDQNNSGGSFSYDESSGISVKVLIEANNAEEANFKAESIGLYWDGCDKGMDCHCCGDRWSPVGDSEASELPKVYDRVVIPDGEFEQGKGFSSIKWMKKGKAEGFMHFADGTFKPFDL